jgi:hypothetical protein
MAPGLWLVDQNYQEICLINYYNQISKVKLLDKQSVNLGEDLINITRQVYLRRFDLQESNHHRYEYFRCIHVYYFKILNI